jgi:hypothetical protein
LLIRPIELPWHCLHENQYQHVVMGDITLSIRKVRGFKFPAKSRYEGVLFVHEKDPDFQVKRLMPDMRVGDVRTLRNGYTVHYHAYENETASIGITRTNEEPLRPTPIPTGFPKSIASAYIDPHHSGSWYNRDFSGQGFDLHVKDGTVPDTYSLALFWYTASQEGGGLIFYSGFALDVPKGTLPTFDMSITRGGTWDNPMTYTEEVVGTAKLEFFDSASGVFHYNFPDLYGNGAIEIVPVARGVQDARNGIWYNRWMVGSGFTCNVFYNGLMAFYWYAYDHLGRQVWFSCEGDFDGELVIYQVRGLEWMYFSKTTTEVVGTAYVRETGDGLLFEYTINSGDIIDHGEHKLVRLF